MDRITLNIPNTNIAATSRPTRSAKLWCGAKQTVPGWPLTSVFVAFSRQWKPLLMYTMSLNGVRGDVQRFSSWTDSASISRWYPHWRLFSEATKTAPMSSCSRSTCLPSTPVYPAFQTFRISTRPLSSAVSLKHFSAARTSLVPITGAFASSSNNSITEWTGVTSMNGRSRMSAGRRQSWLQCWNLSRSYMRRRRIRSLGGLRKKTLFKLSCKRPSFFNVCRLEPRDSRGHNRIFMVSVNSLAPSLRGLSSGMSVNQNAQSGRESRPGIKVHRTGTSALLCSASDSLSRQDSAYWAWHHTHLSWVIWNGYECISKRLCLYDFPRPFLQRPALSCHPVWR